MSAAAATEDTTLSAECTVGKQPGYGYLHDQCRQTNDVPLPHSTGILLLARCRCICHQHRRAVETS